MCLLTNFEKRKSFPIFPLFQNFPIFPTFHVQFIFPIPIKGQQCSFLGCSTGVVSCFDIITILPDQARIQIKLLCSWSIFGFSVSYDTKVVFHIFWFSKKWGEKIETSAFLSAIFIFLGHILRLSIVVTVSTHFHFFRSIF